MRPEDCLEVDSPDEIRLKGHRIWLEDIVARVRSGMSAADIVADLPTLTLGEVEAVLAYSDAHRAEIEAYMVRHETYLVEQMRIADSMSPSPVVARLRRLRDTLKEQGAQEALGTQSASARS